MSAAEQETFWENNTLKSCMRYANNTARTREMMASFRNLLVIGYRVPSICEAIIQPLLSSKGPV
jgi:hypothetical protein